MTTQERKMIDEVLYRVAVLATALGGRLPGDLCADLLRAAGKTFKQFKSDLLRAIIAIEEAKP